MKTNHKFLLSGTPIQNNLQELFALLSFLLPSYLEDFQQIGKQTKSKSKSTSKSKSRSKSSTQSIPTISGEEDHEDRTDRIVEYTKQILEPFILRRVKQDVLTDLPVKTQVIQHITMLSSQQTLYESHIQKYDRQFSQKGTGKEYDLISLYMDLRKIANHPLLVRMCFVLFCFVLFCFVLFCISFHFTIFIIR